MAIRTEPVTINLGPQHPSTHGVFRLRVTFDGEMVLDVEPVLGYMHRGTEALAEGILLIEWPERLGPLLPAERLELRFDFAESADARRVTLTGTSTWDRRLRDLAAP